MAKQFEVFQLAEIHETGVDEMERHIFTDGDLQEFAKGVIKAHATRILIALDATDRGCREPGFRGFENGNGEQVGDELQEAREELAALVGHAPMVEVETQA